MEDYESGVIEVAGSSSSFSRKRIVLTVAASLGVVAIALIALGLFVGVGLQTSSEGEQVMDDAIYEEVFDEIDPEAERYDGDYITPEQYELELQQRQQQEEISDERAERSSCSVNGFSGTCQNTYSQSCVGGAYVSGHCPGAANIKCCVRGGVAACSDGAKQGVCINTNTQSGSCRGTIVSGRCPGASNIRCCARGSGGSTSGSSSSGSSSSGGGSGRVDYRGKTVSDADVRAKLAQISGLYPSGTVYLFSGDRNNGGRSHHDVHRAADFWITGQSSGSAMFNRIRSSGILARDYQIIWHGTRTCTGGQHLHIGRYADNRPSCWVHEGTTSSNYCKYPCM